MDNSKEGAETRISLGDVTDQELDILTQIRKLGMIDFCKSWIGEGASLTIEVKGIHHHMNEVRRALNMINTDMATALTLLEQNYLALKQICA